MANSGKRELFEHDYQLPDQHLSDSHYEIPNPYVSNTHVRIYTIIFDQDASHDVAPLVYAEDLSRNGTSLNTHHMGLGNGGFLLSHGDVLWITRDIAIRFSSTTYVEAECFNGIQSKEMEVSLWIGLKADMWAFI